MFKKIILASTLLLTSSYAYTAKEVKSDFPALKDVEIKEVKKISGGVYNIYAIFNKKVTPLFVDRNSKMFFIGGASTAEGDIIKPLGFENGKAIPQPVSPSDMVKIGRSVAFTMGNPEGQKIFLVTDPECPWCQKLEEDYADKLDKYNISVILMPWHKNSKAAISKVVSAKDPVKTYRDYMLGKDRKLPLLISDRANELAAEARSVKAIMSLKGTPTFFNEKGLPLSSTAVLK